MQAKHRWLGICDWKGACEVDPDLKRSLFSIYGTVDDDINEVIYNRVKNPFCGARYVPWGRGESQVCEIDVTDPSTRITTTLMFIAARLPKELDDEIKKVQGDFMKALGHLTDEEILERLPKAYPAKDYLVDPEHLPGVGRFPVDEWIKEGKPILDTAGWCALCQKIADNDLEHLGGIFDLGVSLEAKAEELARKKFKASM